MCPINKAGGILDRFSLPPFLGSETFSLFSFLFYDWRVFKDSIYFVVGTRHKHIPGSSPFMLFFFCSFLPVGNSPCLVSLSHVNKVHICVHMCNTRYSSNLLLWQYWELQLFKVSACFCFLSWCCRILKKGTWLL